MPCHPLSSNPSGAANYDAVELILELLAAGEIESDLLSDYPRLTREDLLACLAYASHLAHEFRAYPVGVNADSRAVVRPLLRKVSEWLTHKTWRTHSCVPRRHSCRRQSIRGVVEYLRLANHDVVWAGNDFPSDSDKKCSGAGRDRRPNSIHTGPGFLADRDPATRTDEQGRCRPDPRAPGNGE